MMNSGSVDLEALLELAMRDLRSPHLEPVIHKELFHHDILFRLSEEGLLRGLVFQGGTALRLCHGSPRYSEDLDFVGGREFSPDSLKDLKRILTEHLSARYGLQVSIKEPRLLRHPTDHSSLRVDKWQVSIETSPGRPDLPRQRIKIEVANVPAHTRQVLPLKKTYPFLPDGYDNTLIAVESLDEMAADKLVSLAASKYLRHRDIWDLSWLARQGTRVRPDMVKAKIRDYNIADYPALIEDILRRLPSIVEGDEFRDQMRRFLTIKTHEQALSADGRQALVLTVSGLYRELQSSDSAELAR